MSRGLGSVQREVLSVLRASPDRAFPTLALAAMVYATEEERAKLLTLPLGIMMAAIGLTNTVSNAKRVAVSRACHALWRAGAVQKYALRSYNGSCWGIAASSV